MARCTVRALAATLSLVVCASAARAMGGQDCAPEDLVLVEAWIAAHPFHVGQTTPDRRVASACKAAPTDKSVTIVTVAYDSGPQYDKNVVVALVDTQPSVIRSAFKGTIQEDAALTVGEASLRIDTAPYDLAPDRRAFGIDLSSVHSNGCAEGGLGAQLTLFLQDGAVLRPVLDGPFRTSWRIVSGTPACMAALPKDSDDGVVTEHTDMTLAVAVHSTHGLADLVLTRKVYRDAGDARVTRTRESLRFNGSRYVKSDGTAPGAQTIVPEPAPSR